MRAWYNDNDAFVGQWLRNLITAGHLPPGHVDARSILEVEPDDLRSFRQCHFFAGIGGWPYALRLAEWPDHREVWTASLPCQPYSSAGQRRGADDERDLWPAFFRLVRECRPAVIFGEQVASADVVGCGNEADEDVQEMLDKEAVLGILRELQGISAQGLQGVRADFGTCAQACSSGSDSGPSEEMAAREPGTCAGDRGETPREDTKHPVRPQSNGHSEEDRNGTLRVNGHRLQSGRAEGVECPVARPAESRRRIYAGEREGGSLRAERDGEHLGGEPHRRDCQCDRCAAAREVKRLVARNRRSAEGADRLEWLTRIRIDLERIGYAFGACIAPACSVGAPHIRQRLFWVAESRGGSVRDSGCGQAGRAPRANEGETQQRQWIRTDAPSSGLSVSGGVADADSQHPTQIREGDCPVSEQRAADGRRPEQPAGTGAGSRTGNGHLAARDGGLALSERQQHNRSRNTRRGRREFADGGGLGDADAAGSQGRGEHAGEHADQCTARETGESSGLGDTAEQGRSTQPFWPTAPQDAEQRCRSFWSDAVWLPCLDGKARRIESSIQPLAHNGECICGLRLGQLCACEQGPPSRIGMLRGAGNAIIPMLAAEFIKAFMDTQCQA